MAESGSGHTLMEAHEERLQRLEVGAQDFTAKISEYGVKLDYLGQSLDQGLLRLGEKMDSVLVPMGARITEIDTRVQTQAQVVAQLEASYQSRTRALLTLRRGAVALLAALGGALASQAG